jgi:hypothetical protein
MISVAPMSFTYLPIPSPLSILACIDLVGCTVCPVMVANMNSAQVAMVKNGWNVISSVEIQDGVVVLMDSETVISAVAGKRIHSSCGISAVE